MTRAKENNRSRLLAEERTETSDDSGFCMKLQEISLDDVSLRWGEYRNPHEKKLSIPSNRLDIVSHFQLHDSVIETNREQLKENEFVIYRGSKKEHEINIAPTGRNPRLFFELIMSQSLFDNLATNESGFQTAFARYELIDTLSSGFITQMKPRMHEIIHEMQTTMFNGDLKAIFLEGKSIELFLLQTFALDNKKIVKNKLNNSDIDCLYFIKHYIDVNFLAPLSIIGLARRAGINQTKLKYGFGQLFNISVFEYISQLRLKEAKRLLRDEKMPVAEVAETVGYKHPHHFSAAFKKKFGLLPGTFKRN